MGFRCVPTQATLCGATRSGWGVPPAHAARFCEAVPATLGAAPRSHKDAATARAKDAQIGFAASVPKRVEIVLSDSEDEHGAGQAKPQQKKKRQRV